MHVVRTERDPLLFLELPLSSILSRKVSLSAPSIYLASLHERTCHRGSPASLALPSRFCSSFI